MTDAIDIRRRAQDAATRFERVTMILDQLAEQATTDDERWSVSYEAETLLWKVLLDAETLVGILPAQADSGYDLRERSKKLADAIRARYLAAWMDNVKGRTPEEAEAFRAKARQLRGED